MVNLFNIIKKEISRNILVYVVLILIFASGVFLRVYKQDVLLGFWFDQGRDAIVITKIIDEGKLTLIGPTTGFEGIFRGPFYYYFALPGYILGSGDPVAAVIYLAVLNSLGIVFLFIIGRIFWDKWVGLAASFIYAFSFSIISFDRWLSHPPILSVFSPIAFGLILASVRFENFKKLLIPGFFILGLTLQLEEAGMLFVSIAALSFIFLKHKYFGAKILMLAVVVLLVTFIPLLAFDIRHGFLITNNVLEILSGSGHQSVAIKATSIDRFVEVFWYYVGSLGQTIFFNTNWLSGIIPALGLVAFLIFLIKYTIDNKGDVRLQFLMLWVFTPFLFYIFFVKDLYTYYLLGVFPQFCLLLILVLFKATKNMRHKYLALPFLIFFFFHNYPYLHNSYNDSYKDTNRIIIKNQREAMDFISKDAGDQPILFKAYVPPQIPYAYQYLSSWYSKSGKLTLTEDYSQAKFLYAILEYDSTHKNLRDHFVGELDNVSIIDSELFLGGITVQKRILK